MPYRSLYDRPSIVTCTPCARRSRSLGGHRAALTYLVGGRAGIVAGHLVYQNLPQLDGTTLLCLAKQRPLTERAAETLSLGRFDHEMTWNVYRQDDGCEIDSEMNPAGSWLVNRFETDDGPRWAIQRPWDEGDGEDQRAYDNEIDAIADAVAMMVASALSGNEQG